MRKTAFFETPTARHDCSCRTPSPDDTRSSERLGNGDYLHALIGRRIGPRPGRSGTGSPTRHPGPTAKVHLVSALGRVHAKAIAWEDDG
jgi:hypothetical protein